jgi:Ca-activated chloride channel family protein
MPGHFPRRTAPIPLPESGSLVVTAGLDYETLLRGTEKEYFLTIQVSAPEVTGTLERRPVDLAVVMDVSGSMSAQGKIAYAKEAARWLATSMEPQDRYSLVTFADGARVVIDRAPGDTARNLLDRIDAIHEAGSTNLYEGLKVGAERADEAASKGRIGRVVLLSDGKANVGLTDPESLGRLVGSISGRGLTLSTVGLGLEFEEDLLSRLADTGGGSYHFVDHPSDIQQTFAEELRRTASVVARQTEVTVQLPPEVKGLEILGWEARKSVEGWVVPVGDVHAGQTRKIVARVRVRAGEGAELGVAKVEAHYQDVPRGDDGVTVALARVQLTDQPADMRASMVPERALASAQAWGNHQIELSTRAYERGDTAGAARLAKSGADFLRDNATQLNAPSLAREATEAEALQQTWSAAPPESDEARRMVKQAKEWYLDRAR